MFTLNKLSKYIVLFPILIAIFLSLFPGKIVAISILLSYPLIAAMILIFSKLKFPEMQAKQLVRLFIVYGIIVFVRGIIDAKSYQDWTSLMSGGLVLTFLIPLTIFLGANVNIAFSMLRTFVILIPISFILFFTSSDPGTYGFAHTLSPIYLLILLLPYFNKKYRVFIIAVVIISFFRDIRIRANMLNILVAMSIVLTYWVKNKSLTLFSIKFSRYFLLFSPFLFSIMALLFGFNVFTIGENLDDFTMADSDGTKQEVFIDSRTGVYLDVINQLAKDKAVFWGLGASGKTETFLTDSSPEKFKDIYKEGRRGTESGMLNYIQYGGLIGGFLYFLLFIRASFLGIYKSNNWFSVMLGIWIMYRGLFSFVEDRIGFSVGAIFIFVSLGMCYNKTLRHLNDNQLKDLIFNNLTFYKKKKQPLSLEISDQT